MTHSGDWLDTAIVGLFIIVLAPVLVVTSPVIAAAWVVGRLTRRWWDTP